MKKITLLFSAILFTTLINGQCNEPSNVHLYNEPWGPYIYVLWDDNGEELWDIEYGEMGFTPTGIPTVEDYNSTYYELYNITDHIYIDFYVRADCGGTTSDWVGPFTFYNHCFDRVWSEFIVEEDFEGDFIPECWTETGQGAPDTGVGIFGDSAWEQCNFANNSSNTLAAKVNISGTDTNEWLLLPPMRGIEGCKDPEMDLLLEFDIALTESNTNIPTSLGSDDEVKLVISPDLGITWFTIHTWDKDSNILSTGEYFSHIYFDYTDGFGLKETTFLVAIWASSGSIDDTENVDFFIDNVYALPPATGTVIDLKSKGFSFYPNPSNNTINLNAKEKINWVIFYNQLGQEVKKASIDSINSQLDISDLPNAIYFMKVQIGNTVGTVSVIKE